jgi:hypothetical protein
MRENATLCIVARDVAGVTWPLTVARSSVYRVTQQRTMWSEVRGREGRQGEVRHRSAAVAQSRSSRLQCFNNSRMGRIRHNTFHGNRISYRSFFSIFDFAVQSETTLQCCLRRLLKLSSIDFNKKFVQLFSGCYRHVRDRHGEAKGRNFPTSRYEPTKNKV